jgi:dyslexia susceptibility 1 candidate gene 1 protein
MNLINLHIAATSSTLKVNFSPYLIDVVLSGQIDSLRHKARVKDGSLHLTLFKSQPGIWENLEISDDEVQKAKIRTEATEKQKELEDQILERRRDRKVADERFSTRKQMALEEAERSRLDNRKEEEKKTAEEEVYASFAKMRTEAAEEEKAKSRTTAGSKPIPSSAPVAISAAAESKKTGHGLGATYDLKENDIDSDIEDAGFLDVIDEEGEPVEEIYSSNFVHENQFTSHLRGTQGHTDSDADIKYVPPPRMTAGTGTSVGINFTPRVFPTPMRESKQAEEQDWIAKNRKHLKKHGQLGKNITKGKHYNTVNTIRDKSSHVYYTFLLTNITALIVILCNGMLRQWRGHL